MRLSITYYVQFFIACKGRCRILNRLYIHLKKNNQIYNRFSMHYLSLTCPRCLPLLLITKVRTLNIWQHAWHIIDGAMCYNSTLRICSEYSCQLNSFSRILLTVLNRKMLSIPASILICLYSLFIDWLVCSKNQVVKSKCWNNKQMKILQNKNTYKHFTCIIFLVIFLYFRARFFGSRCQ